MNRYNLVKDIICNIHNGVFVEIGTHTGEFANFILENNSTSTLYCIDPYTSYDKYDDAINNITGDDLYVKTCSTLKFKYGERVKFIRKFSEHAVNEIPKDIDFLYIDGNHRYTYVYKDLELFYPKVKNNCYIVGDDAVDIDDTQRNENGDVYIHWCPGYYGHYGVVKAFNEFINLHKLFGYVVGNQYVIKK
jgi:hypothetical protein